jgi:hypothetical protein
LSDIHSPAVHLPAAVQLVNTTLLPSGFAVEEGVSCGFSHFISISAMTYFFSGLATSFGLLPMKLNGSRLLFFPKSIAVIWHEAG